MAFIIENNTVISFAEYDDVYRADNRLFDSNEGLTDDVIENLLIRTTERIVDKISATAWWKSYWIDRSPGAFLRSSADIPAININHILGRHNDFTDLCVFYALTDYILPSIADFGNADNAENRKMGYYQNRADALFAELITDGDWYDFDGDDQIESSERSPGVVNLRRIR